MKKFLIFLIAVMFLPLMAKADAKLIGVHLFYSSSCPHCKEAKAFLKDYENDNKTIKIHYYEVTYNKQNANILNEVQDILDHSSMSVPYIVIGSEITVGFSDNTKEELINLINYYEKNKYVDVVSKIITKEITKENVKDYISSSGLLNEETSVPLLGKINVKEVSIPLLAVVVGLVDGFNPCAMWVLLFLISMLINMKDKKRMWILGVTFLLTSALIYAIMMGAWLKIIINFASVKWIQRLIGLVALIGAFINFRNYYLERKKDSGCQVVDEKKRKKILTRIKKFTAEKSFILAILGVILLAISVNVVELACSAGLPVLFTNILAINNITGMKAILYIGLYILFFLLDDLIVFNVAVFTFKVTGITTKYTKLSHLIGAIIMAMIGILMIVKPSWIMFNF